MNRRDAIGVELELKIYGETERAIKVFNLKNRYVWLPKSLVEIEGWLESEPLNRSRPWMITIPEEIAVEKELV